MSLAAAPDAISLESTMSVLRFAFVVPLAVSVGCAIAACGEQASLPPSSGNGGAASSNGSTSSNGSSSSTTTGSTTSSSGVGGNATTSGSGGSVRPGAILFQEDFENTQDDSVPSGWHSFVGYVVDMNNSKSGQAYALADSTKPHKGARSLHVVGGQTPAMLTYTLPANINTMYVRSYVWLTKKLGQNPGNNHETLLGIRKSVGQANDEIRFGEIKGVIGTNEVPSDDISPTQDQWGKGPVISEGQWHCIEVAFLGDGPKHEIIAWSDGVEVHRVNDPSQWNNGALGATFLSGKFVEFIIGWHSFSSYNNEVWFDDIIVATEKIGCN